ncbi:ABC transporter substrate-binding protein [Paenibacillus sp. PK3_47]|uniref:ABC transporter substrate-binding protein n=1 Tax=Paenibacillus sp. PK3_47 TaxID=2072642 RepID=UPI00201E59BD|nr:ABC transporter substrate-binding protein [Paenibacillus sp. PK3_47]UQZ36226.1 ABC transporter substrate-binding protein [Paenibacillus sp. PK3_47]
MKLHSQFLKLHSQHGGAPEAAVTLDELAQTLGCTHRNALHVIGKMARQGWIRWTPSRGRGRRSRLAFLADAEEIALQSMKMAISSKDMSSALEGIRGHARASSLQDTLQGWLLAYFGHHEEIRSDKVIDTLRLPVTQQLHTFDPLYMNLQAESFVSSHVFDGLVSRSSKQDKLLPGLAHAWDADESRTVWTFHLRKEVLFHHGIVLTAEDVVYSFERMMKTSQRTLYSSIFKEIRKVKALNALTVRFELKQPNELFLPFLCTSRAAIVPRDLENQDESSFGRRPAGTGPFKVVEMNDDCCVLEVFPYYFQGRAHLDRVEVIYVPWGITLPAAGTGSSFHVIPNPSAENSGALSRIHSESSVRKFVTCNTKKKGPLSDPLLRADILSCLDETLSIDNPLTKDSPLTSDSPLAADLKVNLQIATIPQYAGDARYVAEKLGRSGYESTVLPVSPEEFKGPVRLQSDLIVFSLLRDQDEQLRLYDLYLTLSQHMEPRIRADIEGRLKLISREPDAAARAEGFRIIEDHLTRGHQLHILYEKPIETAYLPSVRGVTFNSQGWVDLRHLWFPPSL